MQGQGDFNLNELARQSNIHEQVLNNLYNRVGTDESLGDSFKSAFEKNKDFDRIVTDIIVDNIENNQKIKASIEKVVKNIDRKWWNNAIAKFVIYALGIISTIVVQLILKLLGV